MLSWGEPPPEPPLLESGELLLCWLPWAPPPPLGPPVLGIGIPTLGNPPGSCTPAEVLGPDEPPPL